MEHWDDARKSTLVTHVITLARDRLPEADRTTAQAFIGLVYADLPPDDFVDLDTETLFGQALSLWAFSRVRTPGTTRVRVFNPTLEEHGWCNDHTVVEILTDDMPFLVDSVTAELNRCGLTPRLIVHPVLDVGRDATGQIAAVAPATTPRVTPPPAGSEPRTSRESLMHVHVAAQSDPARLARVEQALTEILDDVRAAVTDWPALRAACLAAIGDLDHFPTPDPATEGAPSLEETRAFLRWLHDDHFTFLGARAYALGAMPAACPPATEDPAAATATDGDGNRDGADRVSLTAPLGILRSASAKAFPELRNLASLPAEVQAFVTRPQALILTKTTERARVHRPVAMDAIVVKQVSHDGRHVIGLRLFVGLFTADVYTNSPVTIPLLREKIRRAIALTGRGTTGHDGRKLLNVIETLPRDELFQMTDAQLAQIAVGILHLQERQRTALFLRQDEFQRFVSCLVFVPRDRHDTRLRRAIQAILEQALDGRVESFSTQVSDQPLARIHFIVRTRPGNLPAYDARAIEDRIADVTRAWADRLAAALVAARGEEAGLALFARYGRAFPAGYRERTGVHQAVSDIEKAEESLGPRGFSMTLYRAVEDAPTDVRFKIVKPGEAIPLSDVLPMLENMGFKVIGEVPYRVMRNGLSGDGTTTPDGSDTSPAAPIWIHDFLMRLPDGVVPDTGHLRGPFQDCFARVWCGTVENDGFNRLVALAGLTWGEVVILRAYARFLRQIAFPSSQTAIEAAMATHPAIARDLVRLFQVRFDPDLDGSTRAEAEAAVLARLTAGLDRVDSPDEDRILRRYVSLITQTLRTNAWQTDLFGPTTATATATATTGSAADQPRTWLSFKINSRQVDYLPQPRPWVEIFVYDPRVEAVHLRGGKVARGGIRWSDRREDFRTEILGLMKAQMVKNAVIVPVGSKGGFIVKRPPADGGRDALLAEGIACYRIMMQALLDLTDSLDGDDVIPPPRVVRHDGDDPYLVVAADKGTARFSDIANEIAVAHGFWLGDAFASGGSHGYDHKAMGITARGAWEAVKRHFRERGHDIQTTPTTVVGVGDMSGDVFGNGLLLSRQLRLVAAFNHQHIIVDPDPDPEASWQERARLFALPRSGWSDYDPAVLSPGGAVFERRAKSLTVSPQVRARFGLDSATLTPDALIRALLRAEVDLLWFGGIGTYVKARAETDLQVGDRANDGLRVNGADLRAAVIGEGANLAVTQQGRIEAALAGVRLNTDAIDNSAGVDCSDHEVNIKILLGGIVAAGDMTAKQRNQLLETMTDEVARLVLRHNALQTQAISLVTEAAGDVLDHQIRLMRSLERAGRLDRALEYLPDDDTVQERIAQGQGLTRPEVAVLMPYAKMWLFDQLMASDLPDDPALEGDLIRYFPAVLGERFPEAIGRHRLRREIISTVVTNSMINRVGGFFVSQMMERTGMDAVDVTRAYIISRDAFDVRRLWDAVEALDGTVPAAVQYDLLRGINQLLGQATLWLLRNGAWPLDLGEAVPTLAATIQALAAVLPDALPPEPHRAVTADQESWVAQGVPEDLARSIALLGPLAAAPDIGRIAASPRDLPVATAARLYFAVGAEFGMDWLRGRAAALDKGSHWTKLAVAAVIEDLFVQQRNLTLAALECLDDPDQVRDPARAIACWRGTNPRMVERADQLLQDLRGAQAVDLAMLTVAARQFRALSGT